MNEGREKKREKLIEKQRGRGKAVRKGGGGCVLEIIIIFIEIDIFKKLKDSNKYPCKLFRH